MLNAYYDYKTNSAFTPYVGIGLGTATTDLEFSPSAVGVISDDDNTFVYQLILGASYTFTENLGAFASYIYRDADEASLNGTLLPARFEINNESQPVKCWAEIFLLIDKYKKGQHMLAFFYS